MSKETCKVDWSKSLFKAVLMGNIFAHLIGDKQAYATEV